MGTTVTCSLQTVKRDEARERLRKVQGSLVLFEVQYVYTAILATMFHPESRSLSPLSRDNNSVFHRVLGKLKSIIERNAK